MHVAKTCVQSSGLEEIRHTKVSSPSSRRGATPRRGVAFTSSNLPSGHQKRSTPPKGVLLFWQITLTLIEFQEGCILAQRGCSSRFGGCNIFLCYPLITILGQEDIIFCGSCRRLHGCPSAACRESWQRVFPHFRPGLPVHSTSI